MDELSTERNYESKSCWLYLIIIKHVYVISWTISSVGSVGFRLIFD